MQIYVDADWAGCPVTRRSTTGYIVYFHGSAINWTSKKQATTAASPMEAEYVAGAEGTRDIIWLRSLLSEIGTPRRNPTTMYIDNQSALSLAGKPSTHSRAKHIDIKHHIIRERVDSQEIRLEYIESSQNRADVFTKPLPGPKHLQAVRWLNLQTPNGV